MYNFETNKTFPKELDELAIRIKNQKSVEKALGKFNNNILNMLDKNFPLRKRKIFNGHRLIKDLIKQKTQVTFMSLFYDHQIYQEIKLSYYDLIGEWYKYFEDEKLNKILYNNKDFSQMYSQIRMITKPDTVNAFKFENDIVIGDKNISNAFLSKFGSSFGKSEKLISIPDSGKYTEFDISMNDILKAFEKINVKKSNGNSLIDKGVLKFYHTKFAPIIYDILKLIIEKEKIPKDLKDCQSTALLKFGKPIDEIGSYRGVCVQNNIFYFLDYIMYVKFDSICTNDGLIRGDQYAYKKGISCENQLCDILSITFDSLDNGCKCVEMIFFDNSNAFNSVSFNKLLSKLVNLGFGGKFLKLIKEYITERSFHVKNGNEKSDMFYTHTGVPQGGHLSSILYSVYIDDLSLDIKNSYLFKYADDVVLIKPIYDYSDCMLLQQDIGAFERFCDNNDLKINVRKSSHLRITSKKDYISYIYSCSGEDIETSDYHQHLGVVLDKNLNFVKHVDQLKKRCFLRFNFLKKQFKYLKSCHQLQLYKTYILPIIEFSNIAWHGDKQTNKKLEGIQKYITKYICSKKGQKNLNYDQRLSSLKIKSILQRKKLRYIKIGHNLAYDSNLIPDYWKSQVSIQTNKRLVNKIIHKRRKLTKVNKYFIDQACFEFNSLSPKLRKENCFKKFCKLINL